MSRQRMKRVFAAMLAAGSLAVPSGCDWLSGSGAGSRQSPFLSNLSIQPASVLCGQEFTVSFRFDDPQADVLLAHVNLQRAGDPTVREESPLWPDGVSRSSGTVSFPLTFTCGTRGGAWAVTVRVEDERLNSSNVLSGEIRLNAAG